MSELPSISIVVPNFMGGKTLGSTLQSLLDQKYERLQIVVVDGGSTDNSVDVIRGFEPHLAWWISEKDAGQSAAINNGFSHCTGEIVNWLCSDDLLEPGCLHFVGETFANESAIDVLVGLAGNTRTPGGPVTTYSYTKQLDIDLMPVKSAIAQPACFYRRRLLPSPPLDESLLYAMDLDLWCRFKAQHARWKVTDRVLARALNDGHNKMSTGKEKIVAEMETVYRRYTSEPLPLTTLYRNLLYPLDRWRFQHKGRFSSLAVRGIKSIVQLCLAPFYGYRRVRTMNWSSYV